MLLFGHLQNAGMQCLYPRHAPFLHITMISDPRRWHSGLLARLSSKQDQVGRLNQDDNNYPKTDSKEAKQIPGLCLSLLKLSARKAKAPVPHLTLTLHAGSMTRKSEVFWQCFSPLPILHAAISLPSKRRGQKSGHYKVNLGL